MLTISTPIDHYFQEMTTFPSNPSGLFLLLVWWNTWSWLLLILPMLLIPLLFPPGSPLSKRWRWVIILLLGAGIVEVFLATFTQSFRPAGMEASQAFPNPIGFIPEQVINGILPILVLPFLILALLCVAALFVRYRHSTLVVKEQIKWLLYACSLFIASYIPFFITAGWNSSSLLDLLITFALMLIPISIGIAILRYRLWDIDVVIRKTLVYTALTILLALVFFGGVALLQQVVGRFSGTEDSPVVIVISTLLIAALFSPLRRRIQDFIDRRFYRQKYNAEQALVAFAETARNETDLDALTGKLVEVVSQTMQPELVSLWMAIPKSKVRQ
jgi:hypothetical protein